MKTINIRLEDNDYELLGEILNDVGQTQQTFYETYTKTVLRLRKIPFIIESSDDPFYSKSNMDRLHHSFKQAEDGKIIHKSIEELEEMARNE